jgi:hypothetical protein
MRGFNEEDYCCCAFSEVLQCAGGKQNMDMDDAIAPGTVSTLVILHASLCDLNEEQLVVIENWLFILKWEYIFRGTSIPTYLELLGFAIDDILAVRHEHEQ